MGVYRRRRGVTDTRHKDSKDASVELTVVVE
jgi:hypothetical protein